MRSNKLGNTGLDVPEICLGTGTFGWTSGKKEAFRILDAALDRGINFIDTAYSYPVYSGEPGEAEEIAGSWIRSRRGKKVVIAAKVGERPGEEGFDLSRKHIAECANITLRRLGVDTIDLYQAHGEDEKTPVEETFAAFADLIRKGKVRYVGVSNYRSGALKKAAGLKKLGLPAVSSVQLSYNLLDRRGLNASLVRLCRAERISVLGYSPLARGCLAGNYMDAPVPEDRRDSVLKYLAPGNTRILKKLEAAAGSAGTSMARVALAWVTSNPAVTSAIIGASSAEQLMELTEPAEIAPALLKRL